MRNPWFTNSKVSSEQDTQPSENPEKHPEANVIQKAFLLESKDYRIGPAGPYAQKRNMATLSIKLHL